MINKANVAGRSHPSANGTPRLTKWSTNSITSRRKKSKLWKVRMKTLSEHIKSQENYAQFNSIPGRIFLDTNVLHYLQVFGEYIFEHYRENEVFFKVRKGKIKRIPLRIVAVID